MNRKQFVYRSIMVFGLVTLIAAAVDFFAVVIPTHVSSPEWVYFATQNISERVIIALMGIIAIIFGLFKEEKLNQKLSLRLEQGINLLSLLIASGLILSTLMFLLVLNKVENNAVSALNKKAEITKKQVLSIQYRKQLLSKSPRIMPNKDTEIELNDEVKAQMKTIDSKLNQATEQKKFDLRKNNIKTIINLLGFIFAYLFIGLAGFMRSSRDLKILKLSKK